MSIHFIPFPKLFCMCMSLNKLMKIQIPSSNSDFLSNMKDFHDKVLTLTIRIVVRHAVKDVKDNHNICLESTHFTDKSKILWLVKNK